MWKYICLVLAILVCTNEFLAIPARIEKGWWLFVVLGCANLIIWPCLTVMAWRKK